MNKVVILFYPNSLCLFVSLSFFLCVLSVISCLSAALCCEINNKYVTSGAQCRQLLCVHRPSVYFTAGRLLHQPPSVHIQSADWMSQVFTVNY